MGEERQPRRRLGALEEGRQTREKNLKLGWGAQQEGWRGLTGRSQSFELPEMLNTMVYRDLPQLWLRLHYKGHPLQPSGDQPHDLPARLQRRNLLPQCRTPGHQARSHRCVSCDLVGECRPQTPALTGLRWEREKWRMLRHAPGISPRKVNRRQVCAYSDDPRIKVEDRVLVFIHGKHSISAS